MAEEKKNRSEELESLDKKINEIINGWNQNPEEIVEFLQFSSKFSYAYSPRNMMLIAQQQRGALLCKSFKAWKELGYSVKKGEHGMEVYVHTPITILKTDDGDIPYSKASKEQQAAYDVGEIEGEKLSYFKKGYTFDITQTNFPPEKYPKLLDRGIPSEFHRSCTNILKEYCEENLGLKVFLQDQEQNIKGVSLYGYHSPSEHEIHIASTLQDTAAFSTLTHEFGHALAHGSVEESLNTNLHQKEFEQFIFPNCKYGINLFIALFDTSTGKILRARMLDLPCLFSKKIRSAIVLQALQPFNKEKYIKVIKQFTFFHSQEEIAVQSKLSSRCTVHYRASQTVPIRK